MLPHLKNKQDSMAAVPPAAIERKHDDGSDPDPLEGAMQELHAALGRSDYKEAAEIFRSALDLMESSPHTEGAHKES